MHAAMSSDTSPPQQPPRRAWLAALLCAAGAHAAARASPRTLRLVVTFGAGGIADVVTRLLAPELARRLDQPVVVENRVGASGAIGAMAVARAVPDGHTLLMGTPATQVINPMVHARLGYDPWTDFVPVSLLTEAPLLLALRPMPGVDDLATLVRHARANPGALSYTSAGPGTTPHLAMELFQRATRTTWLHLPYKSGAEAVAAVAGGQADAVVEAATVLVPMLQAGRLRPLCAAGARRCALLADVATAAELGLDGFRVTPPWLGLAAPRGTPQARLAALQAAAADAMADPALRRRLLERGLEPLPPGPQPYRALLLRERADWGPVVRAARIRVG